MTATVDHGLDRVLEYVEAELGFASTHYNDAYLRRRVTARMRRTGVASFDDYRRRLASDESEATALLDALSINVTGFFRNPPMWRALRSVLVEQQSARGRLRLWSAACADGREAYSLAMLLAATPELDASRARILATDINEAALERARAATYRSTRTTDIGEQLAPIEDPTPYVERDGDRFTVRPAVADRVEFERHDLIRDGARGPFDLVLCRNLLIYIEPASKGPIVDTLHASLTEGGLLVVGMAETLPPAHRERFETVTGRARIHRRVD